jgi:hypothetical protein
MDSGEQRDLMQALSLQSGDEHSIEEAVHVLH